MELQSFEAGFLVALIEGEGNIHRKTRTLTIVNTDKDIIDIAFSFLKSFNIRASIGNHHSIKYISEHTNYKPAFRLRICNRVGLEKIKEMYGSLETNKKIILKEILSSYIREHYESRKNMTITELSLHKEILKQRYKMRYKNRYKTKENIEKHRKYAKMYHKKKQKEQLKEKWVSFLETNP
jgi:putative lipase involved disintegration of autophagic bodies